ncbi:MAG: hypothetical protein Barrevirus14_17 [Barrevirus sp.]|uniref:Uncharacterized protein n=1 Tax=Barrevirus sp. TaxID=2487763 RepID=A0A3G4ZQH4_9VIRU|nr:MAG: hypothetical protein Barrevirus14_17 [Barrevirus sp.]
MSVSNNGQCVNCNGTNFLSLYRTDNELYCDTCYPDPIEKIRERRKYEDLILGIDDNTLTNKEKDRLTIFYEKIIEMKNQEIKYLRSLLKEEEEEEKDREEDVMEINESE